MEAQSHCPAPVDVAGPRRARNGRLERRIASLVGFSSSHRQRDVLTGDGAVIRGWQQSYRANAAARVKHADIAAYAL